MNMSPQTKFGQEAPCSSEAEQTYYSMHYNHPEDYNFCDLIFEGMKRNI